MSRHLECFLMVFTLLFLVACKDSSDGITIGGLQGGGAQINGIILFAEAGNIRDGNMGDRAGIDVLCNNSANKPSGASIVKGFISTGPSDGISDFPTNHGFSSTKSIFSLSGSTIATNWSDLMEPSTMTTSLASHGVLPSGQTFWSGVSSATGSEGSSTEICQGSTPFSDNSSSATGTYGNSDDTNATWIFNNGSSLTDACDNTRYLLCVAE
ncbi:MAG: hypothetical protein GY786_02765 [Proteobacteria bacterium]|nr:hypothetical protein [Pseudomonadota bacterium]